MVNLKDSALAYEKKDIFSLDKIPVDVEIKKGTFEKNGQKQEYSYFELEGWKYNIKAPHLEKIKQVLEVRPDTKNVKAKKDSKGDTYFVPVD